MESVFVVLYHKLWYTLTFRGQNVFVSYLVIEAERSVWAEVIAPVLRYHHIFGVRVREFAVVVGGSVPPPDIDFVVILALFVLLAGFDVLHRDRLIESIVDALLAFLAAFATNKRGIARSVVLVVARKSEEKATSISGVREVNPCRNKLHFVLLCLLAVIDNATAEQVYRLQYALVRISVRKPISFLYERFLNGTNDEIDVEVFSVKQLTDSRATSGSAVPRRISA